MKTKLTSKGPGSTRKNAAAEGTPARIHLKQILVPVDFSDFSRKALRYALSFAESFGAQITVLYVLEPMPYPNDFMVSSPMVLPAQQQIKPAQQHLRKVCDEFTAAHPDVNIVPQVALGHAAHEICEAARKLNTDLIIVATHGYTGLKHVLMGSTAEQVVRHAPCPVLTVREKEHEFID
ncbi:MAG TPA: universal stress protein [Verrucomicrobiae bacterium]|jgi:nucleotide-binding universal stress UspA family protein